MTTTMPLKIEVLSQRMDSCGLKLFTQELNKHIELGYRFIESDLFADQPRLRAGVPKFTMVLPKYYSKEDVVEEESPILSWYKDEEVKKEMIATLSADGGTKVKVLELAASYGIAVPEDITHPASIKKFLIAQIESYS